MSREIKLKIWDKVLQCWSKNTFHFNMNKEGIMTPDRGDRYIVVQFIGLKRDGVDIYEGDIIEYPVGKFPTGSHYMRGFLRYHKLDYRFCTLNQLVDPCKKNAPGTIISLKDIDACKVIGNIYENPELSGDDNAN